MIVLDEQLLGRQIEHAIERWYRGTVRFIPEQQRSDRWPRSAALADGRRASWQHGRRLISLKYISDAFEAQHAQLEAEQAHGADPEDPDEYHALNIFRVPQEVRWRTGRRRPDNPLSANSWTML